MAELNGVLRPERLACGDPKLDPDREHLPATYNPLHDVTACICGGRWWEGRTKSVWKSVQRFRERTDVGEIRRGVGMGANGVPDRYESLSWDTYELRTA